MPKKKRERYERQKFDLKECEANINIIEKADDKRFGTAFLNVKLPDGRWVTFEMVDCYRVPLFKEEEG